MIMMVVVVVMMTYKIDDDRNLPLFDSVLMYMYCTEINYSEPFLHCE